MTDRRLLIPEMEELISHFYASLSDLGRFALVASAALPDVSRRLLSHGGHMTEAHEDFYGTPVVVEALSRKQTEACYARKSLLRRKSDERIVQLGIMRIRYDLISDAVRRDIESESIPLGRILKTHNVLREVKLFALWRIDPGAELAEFLGAAPGASVYGRTAMIHVDHLPGVEL
ncbi:MAG: hypothetical protein KDA42_19265, partial [Planctomycetales bacterium]|nr:hypothetical protein [Planctomycetales bacterium]